MKLYCFCINKGKIKNLTYNKKYIVTRVVNGIHNGTNIPYKGYYIINDSNIEHYYSAKRFETVKERRLKTISDILS